MSKSIYEFWLSFNNEEQRLQLPMNPEILSIESGSSNDSVDVSGLGEITILKDPRAKIFSFSSLFPKEYTPACEYVSIPDPQETIELIESWKNSKKPIRFIVTNTNINYPVSIEDFPHSESGGDVGSKRYSLTLKEYRFVKPREVEVKQNKIVIKNAVQREDTRTPPQTYTVKPGDNLWKIATKHLKDGSKYPSIASLNGIKPPYTIYPGQVLKIPS